MQAKEAPKGASKPAAAASDSEGASGVSLLIDHCIKSPQIVSLALCYFFVYAVRQGVTSWLVFFLLQAKGLPDVGLAALRVSGLELGGLLGSLIAGRMSDHLIRNAAPGEGAVGKRVQVGARRGAPRHTALAWPPCSARGSGHGRFSSLAASYPRCRSCSSTASASQPCWRWSP